MKKTPEVRLRCCHNCCQPGRDHLTAVHGQRAYVVDLETPTPASVFRDIARSFCGSQSPPPARRSAEFWSSSLAADEFRPAHLCLGNGRVGRGCRPAGCGSLISGEGRWCEFRRRVGVAIKTQETGAQMSDRIQEVAERANVPEDFVRQLVAADALPGEGASWNSPGRSGVPGCCGPGRRRGFQLRRSSRWSIGARYRWHSWMRP